MDKHWKDVQVGDIICSLEFAYFKLCESEFMGIGGNKHYGKHFMFIGSTDIMQPLTMKDVWGYELLEHNYKIVDELPYNLYK